MGILKPQKPVFFDQFNSWIAERRYGAMLWLAKHRDLREHPHKLLENCRTIITLAYPYSAIKPSTPDGFSVARYTEFPKIDYHNRLRRLAKDLAESIKKWYPGSKTRVCVDSAPILERSLAYASISGFIGKNNMFILPDYGSYLFLIEILTSADLPLLPTLLMKNQCASCSRCIEACPTGALERPFFIDASKCLSYLTIEYKEEVDNITGGQMGKCFFGCDICQEVCPFNDRKSAKEFVLPQIDEWLRMTTEEFDMRFGRTALARAGLKKIRSNIRAIRVHS